MSSPHSVPPVTPVNDLRGGVGCHPTGVIEFALAQSTSGNIMLDGERKEQILQLLGPLPHSA